MPAASCHVPITIRVSGELSDELLVALKEKLRIGVAGRLAASRAELARRDHPLDDTARARNEAPEERMAAERFKPRFGAYLVPSYDDGGTLTPVRLEPSSAATAGSVTIDDLALPADRTALIAALVQEVGRNGVWAPGFVLDKVRARVRADHNYLDVSGGVPLDWEEVTARLALERRIETELESLVPAFEVKFADLRRAFRNDVRGLAFRYLSRNREFVLNEMGRLMLRPRALAAEQERYWPVVALQAQMDPALGIPVGERNARLRELRRLSVPPAMALRLQERLRTIQVGTIQRAKESFEPQYFDPTVRPVLGDSKKWEQLKTQFDRLQGVINRYTAHNPALYALVHSERLQTFAGATEGNALEIIANTFNELLGHIDQAQDKIWRDEIDYRDLLPLHERLFGGEKSDSGTDWSHPFHRAVADYVLKLHERVEFWKDLGLTTLAAAAFIFAEIATGGAATFLLAGGLAITAYQIGERWEQYDKLSLAESATVSDELALVRSGQVADAETAAILTTVMGILTALGPAAKVLGVTGRVAGEAAEVGAAGRAAARTWTKEELERFAAKPEWIRGFLGGEAVASRTTGKQFLVRVAEAGPGKGGGMWGYALFDTVEEAESYAKWIAQHPEETLRKWAAIPEEWKITNVKQGAAASKFEVVKVFEVPPDTAYLQGPVAPQLEFPNRTIFYEGPPTNQWADIERSALERAKLLPGEGPQIQLDPQIRVKPALVNGKEIEIPFERSK